MIKPWRTASFTLVKWIRGHLLKPLTGPGRNCSPVGQSPLFKPFVSLYSTEKLIDFLKWLELFMSPVPDLP